jgi:hypothetical protein
VNPSGHWTIVKITVSSWHSVSLSVLQLFHHTSAVKTQRHRDKGSRQEEQQQNYVNDVLNSASSSIPFNYLYLFF